MKVIQLIKLVKYNRKSHEIITLICKRIPTMVNKKIHKNKHSHEMTRFWSRIALWTSLHEPVLIYGSSHGSVFKSPLCRVHNEHESGSGLGLLQRVQILPNESKTLQQASEHMNSHKYTLVHVYTPQHTRINIRVHSVSYTHLTLPTIYSV